MRRAFLCLLCVILLPQISFSRSLEEIKNSGTIKIGTADIDFKPVHYRDKENNRTGIDIDLINTIARRMGVKLDLVLFKGAERRMAILVNDEVDLVVSNFSITPARLEEIDFSIPYLTTGIGLILNNKLKGVIKEYSDLKNGNIKISLISGSTQHKIFQEQFPNVELVVYNTSADAFKAFTSGLTDGYSTDALFLLPTVSQNPDKYYILEGTLTADPYGVGVNKKYRDLLGQINIIINDITRNGELQKIIERHTTLQNESIEQKMIPTSQASKVEQKESPTKPQIIHTVAEGDTLAKIAISYYKKPHEWKRIYEANREAITNPNALKSGTKLLIPEIALEPSSRSTEKTDGGLGVYSEPVLSYINDLYRRELISKEVHDEISEKGRRYILESQLLRLKERYKNGDVSKEMYEKEQISLLKDLF